MTFLLDNGGTPSSRSMLWYGALSIIMTALSGMLGSSFVNIRSKGSIKSGIIFPIATIPCGICTTVVFINERFIKINQYPPALVEYFLFQKVGSAGFDHIVSFTKRGMPLHKTMKNLPLIQTAS